MWQQASAQVVPVIWQLYCAHVQYHCSNVTCSWHGLNFDSLNRVEREQWNYFLTDFRTVSFQNCTFYGFWFVQISKLSGFCLVYLVTFVALKYYLNQREWKGWGLRRDMVRGSWWGNIYRKRWLGRSRHRWNTVKMAVKKLVKCGLGEGGWLD